MLFLMKEPKNIHKKLEANYSDLLPTIFMKVCNETRSLVHVNNLKKKEEKKLNFKFNIST